jgi:hypothetical protein
MLCERYKEVLIDAPASGAPLPAEARAHLNVCPACRALFEREQSLFAAIDTGVRQIANADVPPSLLPVLRVRLAEEAPHHGARGAGWLYLAAATVVLLLALIPLLRQRSPGVETAHQDETPQPTPKQQMAPKQMDSPSPVEDRHAPPNRGPRSTNTARTAANHQPEVIVPLEEREAFARFVSTLSGRSRDFEALARRAPANETPFLKIEPLQIAQLEVQPLEEVQPESKSER